VAAPVPGAWDQLAYRDLEVGDVLKTSFSALLANILTIGPIAAMCLGPSFVGRIVYEMLIQNKLSQDDWRLYASSVIFFLVSQILEYVAQAAVTFVVVEHLAGRKVAIGHGLQYTLSRFLPITFTALTVSLCVGLGMVFLVAPGVILACMFFVAVPVTVVEKVGPFSAMGRSMELTQDRRMAIFLVLLCYAALSVSLSMGGFVGVGWAGEIVSAMLFAVLGAVVYVRLRGIRDGIDAVSLASVFE